MLSLAASELPEGLEWEYEVKFDGYRAQGIRTAGRVQLRSRYNANFMTRFPTTEDMKKCRWLNPRIVA